MIAGEKFQINQELFFSTPSCSQRRLDSTLVKVANEDRKPWIFYIASREKPMKSNSHFDSNHNNIATPHHQQLKEAPETGQWVHHKQQQQEYCDFTGLSVLTSIRVAIDRHHHHNCCWYHFSVFIYSYSVTPLLNIPPFLPFLSTQVEEYSVFYNGTLLLLSRPNKTNLHQSKLT